MRSKLYIAVIALGLVLALIPPAGYAAVGLQLVTLGSPQGTMHSLPPPQGLTIPGWTATTVRLISNSGNITGVNFAGIAPNGYPRGVYGCLAQIWIAPNGDGNYTQTTPGFRTENNSFPSEFNLDSHFLGDPANYIVHSPLEEGNVDFPGFNPIPSDGTYGYGNGTPLHLVHQLERTGYLRGAYDVVPSGQRSFLDLAYVAVGGGGEILGDVYTSGGTFEMAIGFGTGPPFPEPGSAALIMGDLVRPNVGTAPTVAGRFLLSSNQCSSNRGARRIPCARVDPVRFEFSRM